MENQDHHTHEGHTHVHSDSCGHAKIKHGDHTDFLHEGHLHSVNNGEINEHKIEVSLKNPNECTPNHTCQGHSKDHEHGVECGHEAVPHGDHLDYLVDGHLHHAHGTHCDDHGPVTIS